MLEFLLFGAILLSLLATALIARLGQRPVIAVVCAIVSGFLVLAFLVPMLLGYWYNYGF